MADFDIHLQRVIVGNAAHFLNGSEISADMIFKGGRYFFVAVDNNLLTDLLIGEAPGVLDPSRSGNLGRQHQRRNEIELNH